LRQFRLAEWIVPPVIVPLLLAILVIAVAVLHPLNELPGHRQHEGVRENRGPARLTALSPRHCEPPGQREAPPDDRLREAIHRTACADAWIASSLSLSLGAHSRDPLAPRNDAAALAAFPLTL
jgi:hypothetical protein